MCLLFVKTVVVINKSTEVPLNTLHKCIVVVAREGGGGGGNPLYLLYRCVRRQRVKSMFFYLFWSKKGYQFRPVWSGYVFLEEATSS